MFGIPINLTKPRSVFHISSLDENKVANFYKKQYERIVCFNSYHLTRIYPSGSRVDSSNYDPIPSFNAGCHLIALNF